MTTAGFWWGIAIIIGFIRAIRLDNHIVGIANHTPAIICRITGQ